MNKELIEQSAIAFDFVQKLNFECATCLREIVRFLADADEKFTIGRPSGYGVAARGSTGIEHTNVARWLTRHFSVFFVPEQETQLRKGQTQTNLHPQLR